MQAGEFQTFAETLGKVAVAFSRDLDDPTIDIFWKALKEIPLELIKRTAGHIIKYETRWCSPAKWRQVADDVNVAWQNEKKALEARQPQRQLPGIVDPETGQPVLVQFYCGNCQDTGWRPACGCPMDKIQGGTKNGECSFHGGVTKGDQVYRQPMKACECRAENPAWLKEHETQLPKYSKKRRDDE